ncbi:MAG: RNA pseudouridine synthase [Proteobacteria bacterium]|nr:MAG: RNA pseudouridine synthase [Pseudomonadota bacterium]
MSGHSTPFAIHVDPQQAGARLDAMVADSIDNCSRSFATTLIQRGNIQVDGVCRKPAYRVKAGQKVSGAIPSPDIPVYQAQNLALDILYEDTDIIFINKPPGMVVHPAPGHPSGTLVNALLHHCPDLAGISGTLRPGIVHRLDKNTSGVMVAAKNSRSMHSLSDQFKSRTVRKRYLALVYGLLKSDSGSIERPIGRHPTNRKRMSVVSRSSRPALTRWQVRERFKGTTLLDLDIRTGRTHQIRVHCQAIGHPVVGDPVYANRGAAKQLAVNHGPIAQRVSKLQRQMLHAWKLKINHPVSNRSMTIEAPLPDDMTTIIDQIRSFSNQ